MRLQGLHHITMITGDAPATVEFQSIYFREPRGVLFEIATLSPGFAIDEDPEHLGEELRLPQQHAHLRERLERALTPLSNPRRTRETA